MKKQKKGKTASNSSALGARSSGAQTPPEVFHISNSAPPNRVSTLPRPGELPLSTAAARCRQLYVTYTSHAAGRISLDGERLAQALAEAGIGTLAEQALYSLALMSAADGHTTLFEADVIAALENVSALTQKAS